MRFPLEQRLAPIVEPPDEAANSLNFGTVMRGEEKCYEQKRPALASNVVAHRQHCKAKPPAAPFRVPFGMDLDESTA